VRTGPIHNGNHVVRWRVTKDARGLVIAPARIVLVGKGAGPESLPCADALLPASRKLLHSARVGDIVRMKDSRGKKRQVEVTAKTDHACLCSCEQGAYILSRAAWSLMRKGQKVATGRIGIVPSVEEPIRLNPGGFLVLTKEERAMSVDHRNIPHISCTLSRSLLHRAGGSAHLLRRRQDRRAHPRGPFRSDPGRDYAHRGGRGQAGIS